MLKLKLHAAKAVGVHLFSHRLGSGRLISREESAVGPTLRQEAKAPTSPKAGALPFSLSSHKENQ